MSDAPITVLSSMATRTLLAALAQAFERATGTPVRLESVGGVDAAKRVRAGEAFDLVVLAEDALAALAAEAWVQAPRALAESGVAVAVHADAPRPDIGSEAAVRAALLAAGRIAYSTGPSGQALLQLLERWGLAGTLAPRLLQARPGVPVGQLVAAGEADLGLQQYSELMDLPGLALLGRLPPAIAIVTTFAGAVGARSARPAQAQALLDFMAAAPAAALKRAHGMDAPQPPSAEESPST